MLHASCHRLLVCTYACALVSFKLPPSSRSALICQWMATLESRTHLPTARDMLFPYLLLYTPALTDMYPVRRVPEWKKGGRISLDGRQREQQRFVDVLSRRRVERMRIRSYIYDKAKVFTTSTWLSERRLASVDVGM